MFVEHKFYIGFRDVNFSQELTNTSLLGFLENLAGIHSNKVNDRINNKTTWILLNWKVKVLKRPRYAETIRVKTWSRSMEKFYAFRDFEVYNEKNELICIASSKWVHIDLEKGRIAKLTEEQEKSYETESISVFEDNEDFAKLKEPEQYENCVEFKITRSMIDTNYHLHNIYYLDIAKEVMPEEVFLNKKIEFDDFEIMYKKEIKYGDKVKAFYFKDGEYHYITVKNYEEDVLHSIIRFKE